MGTCRQHFPGSRALLWETEQSHNIHDQRGHAETSRTRARGMLQEQELLSSSFPGTARVFEAGVKAANTEFMGRAVVDGGREGRS